MKNINKYFQGRCLFLIFFMQYASYFSIGQEAVRKNDFQLSAGAGIAGTFARDFKNSGIIFSGVSPAAIFQLNYSGLKVKHTLIFNGIKGALHTESPIQYNAQNVFLNASYSNYIRLTSPKKSFEFSAGGLFDFLHIKRTFENFINNDIVQQSVFSLGMALSASMKLPEKQDLTLTNHFQMPFLFLINQPGFYDGDDLYTSDLSGFYTLGKVLRMKNILSLKKEINGKHAISFSYIWDYYHFNSGSKTTQAAHQFLLAYIYTL